ncbi:hypothetical protein ACJMK2_016180 [Sinanodonta woodiana]|uniref:Uncharacterized protein n=1 Tax=Sinanodonta woodiana TaxID=1069815 RepID=A0ABD3UVG1_SINWO
MSTANSTTDVTTDASLILGTSNASTVTSSASTVTSSASTVTSSVSTSNGTGITSISTTATDASNGPMTSSDSTSSVTYVTLTGTVSLSSSHTSYVTTNVESFNSSINNITTNPSTNAETSNVLNNTVTLNVSTSTVYFNATHVSSIQPSDLTPYRTTLYLDATNITSSTPHSSLNYSNDNSDLTIALSVSLSVIFLVICIAVISILLRKSRRKRLSLQRAPVRIEVPDIFIRLSNELVSHKCEQISQSPNVFGMEEIKRLSNLSIMNSKIPDKKADNHVTVSPKPETIATIDITDHTSQGTANGRKKGDNRAFVPEIALVQMAKISGNTGEFHKQKRKDGGVSQTAKLETSKTTEDETFTEIKL